MPFAALVSRLINRSRGPVLTSLAAVDQLSALWAKEELAVLRSPGVFQSYTTSVSVQWKQSTALVANFDTKTGGVFGHGVVQS